MQSFRGRRASHLPPPPTFPPLTRKFRALRAIYSASRHWPTVAAARLGLGDGGRVLTLRNGLELCVKESLAANWGQFFESAVADVYRVSSAEADTFVDVGANLGGFSCLAAWTHPGARIYAFKPQVDQADMLRLNLERNHINNVDVTEAPVTADGREVVLYQQSNDGASNIYQDRNGTNSPRLSVTLECAPIAEANSVFFKFDCEGAEGELIEWIADHAAHLPGRAVLACEYHPLCDIPIERSARLLTSVDFRTSIESHFAETYLFARRE